MTNSVLKSLKNRAPTDDERLLSAEAKPDSDSRDPPSLVANTSHADNAFGRESSATFSHREHLLKNLHTISSAEGSPKCMFFISAITEIIATETKLGAPVQHRT